MEFLLEIAAVLTTLVGFVGLGVIGAAWNKKPDNFIFGIALLFGITSMFGLTNILGIEIDPILYPIRLAIMVWCVYIFIK